MSSALGADPPRRSPLVLATAALAVAVAACPGPGASDASPSPAPRTPVPLDRALAWAGDVDSYRFDSEIAVAGEGRPAAVRVTGAVRERGEDLPDLHATVESEGRRLELLRLGGRVWTRLADDEEWALVEEAPAESVGVPMRSLSELLEVLEDAETEGAEDGFEVTGRVPAEAFGVGGSGFLRLTLVLDADARLESFSYSGDLEVAEQDRELRLEVSTSLSQVGEVAELPTPPPG